MGSVSHHITPVVINSLEVDTHTCTHSRTEAIILRNQVHAGLWPAHTWFKSTCDCTPVLIKISKVLLIWLGTYYSGNSNFKW